MQTPPGLETPGKSFPGQQKKAKKERPHFPCKSVPPPQHPTPVSNNLLVGKVLFFIVPKVKRFGLPSPGFDDRVVAHVEVGGVPGPPPPLAFGGGPDHPPLAGHQSLPPPPN
jgi:hypothetical protein